MDDDQQFCLRWNNHQSTLVAVFDTLLENGVLVDCTLAAEGKYLNAHKVVLSACSPYFEALLSQNYDKHPIFILKDVKYQELKAMMDYMYRGEVNISQDQLGALLKAAESLQIKGLSDSRKGENEKKTAPPPAKSPPPAPSLPKVQGLTIEQRRKDLDENSRDGSQSPGPRRRKRARRRSGEELENNHDASNSSESHHSTPAQNIPSLPVNTKLTDVPEPVETKQEILLRHKASESEIIAPQVPIKEKLETHTELMLEPKAEYVEEMNDDSIEDLTLDDDDLSNMEQMDDQGAGPSHGNMGEGSGQGFGWHMGNQSQDEVFLAAQEAVGAHRDSQVEIETAEVTVMTDHIKTDEVLKLSKIKEELSTHIQFAPVEQTSSQHVKHLESILIDSIPIEQSVMETEVAEEVSVMVQEESDDSASQIPILSKIDLSNSPKVIIMKNATGRNSHSKLISNERMKLFLSMKPSDLPKPGRKVLACEKNQLKTPRDTIRCANCGVLYDRVLKLQHMKDCKKGNKNEHRYGCAYCSFKHPELKEIEKHIDTCHRK